MAETIDRVAVRWHLLWRALLAIGLALLFSVYVDVQAGKRQQYTPEEILNAGKAGGGWAADIARRQADLEWQAKSLAEQSVGAPVAERVRLLRQIAGLGPQRAALQAEADKARAAEAEILGDWRRRTDRTATVYFPIVVCFVSCLALLLLTQHPPVIPDGGGKPRLWSWPLGIIKVIYEVPVGMALAGLTAYTMQAQYGAVWPELEPATVIVLGTAIMLLACITGSLLAAMLYQRWQLLGVGALLALAGLIAADQVLGWHPSDIVMQRVAALAGIMAVVWCGVYITDRRRRG